MIKKEVGFGSDNFGKPKVLSDVDSISQVILNILLSKPGNYPSLPHIGIDIKSYLYKLEEEIDVLDLRSKIYSQCQELLSMVVSDDIKFYINRDDDGKPILILYIPVTVDTEPLSTDQEGIMFAFSNNNDNQEGMSYIFKYQRLPKA